MLVYKLERTKMMIRKSDVIGYLRRHLVDKDHEHIEWLADISILLFIVHEFSFNVPKEQNEQVKDDFMRALMSPMVIVAFNFPHNSTTQDQAPNSEDFDYARRLYKEILERSGGQKDLLNRLIVEKWSAGRHQRLAYNMDVEGSIMNEVGIILASAMKILTYADYESMRKPAVEAK